MCQCVYPTGTHGSSSAGQVGASMLHDSEVAIPLMATCTSICTYIHRLTHTDTQRAACRMQCARVLVHKLMFMYMQVCPRLGSALSYSGPGLGPTSSGTASSQHTPAAVSPPRLADSHPYPRLSPWWPGSQPGSGTGCVEASLFTPPTPPHPRPASPKLSLEFHCIKLLERNGHGVSWPLLSSLLMASNPEALEAGLGPHRKPI